MLDTVLLPRASYADSTTRSHRDGSQTLRKTVCRANPAKMQMVRTVRIKIRAGPMRLRGLIAGEHPYPMCFLTKA